MWIPLNERILGGYETVEILYIKEISLVQNKGWFEGKIRRRTEIGKSTMIKSDKNKWQSIY